MFPLTGQGGFSVDVNERREHGAQREAVEQVLPAPGRGSLFRLASGEVLVYAEEDSKRRPTSLRAAVMPDGKLVEFQTDRFKRS